jgi:hypothetical protein
MTLAVASGAADVVSFLRLGNVFASVMTGNLVLFGLGVARRSGALFGHSTTALAGYVAGVALGAVIGRGIRESLSDVDEPWPCRRERHSSGRRARMSIAALRSQPTDRWLARALSGSDIADRVCPSSLSGLILP